MSTLKNLATAIKMCAMDAIWHEEQHHRSDNGRFTSGSGRGKSNGSAEEKGKGKSSNRDGGDSSKQEMGQKEAEECVRTAFAKCGGAIDKMELEGHHLTVKTNFSDLKALNKELGERGLKAKQENSTTLHIAEDAAEDYENDPFFKLLVCLMQIGFYAKDLHYRATGNAFFAIHELADLAWKASKLFDDINEIRYMGELGTIPPSRQLVAAEAAKGMEQSNNGEGGAQTTRQLIERVLAAVENTEEAVVAAKDIGCAAGTNAILDEVSKECLKVSGLLCQTLKRDDVAEIQMVEPQPVNTKAIDRVIEKGIFIKPGEVGQDAGTSEGAKKGWEKRKHGASLEDALKEATRFGSPLAPQYYTESARRGYFNSLLGGHRTDDEVRAAIKRLRSIESHRVKKDANGRNVLDKHGDLTYEYFPNPHANTIADALEQVLNKRTTSLTK